MNNNIFFKTLLLKGEAGQSIGSIEKTSTSGVVDTYTITLTDGTTSTFEVTNGSSISNISLTSSSGVVDTYTITLTDGSTTTFNVTNGEDFTVPADGILFYEGAGVPDGYEASDPPMAKSAVEMSYARYQTLTEAEKTDGTIYMVYDDPTDNYVVNNGFNLNYSTDEQLTGGKWVDNKPIYQKTIYIENGISLTTNANVSIQPYVSDLNIETPIDCLASRFTSSNRGGASVRVGIWLDGGALKLVAPSTWNFMTHITIWYTKTTDTV